MRRLQKSEFRPGQGNRLVRTWSSTARTGASAAAPSSGGSPALVPPRRPRAYGMESVKLSGAATKTSIKQPVATAANGGDAQLLHVPTDNAPVTSISYDFPNGSSLLALLSDFDFLEQRDFDLPSHSIIPVMQFDDLGIKLPPAGWQPVDDFLNDMEFT